MSIESCVEVDVSPIRDETASAGASEDEVFLLVATSKSKNGYFD